MDRSLRFFGKEKLQKAISNYIDDYFDYYDDLRGKPDDFRFIVHQ